MAPLSGLGRPAAPSLLVARRLHQPPELVGRVLAPGTRLPGSHLQGDRQELLLISLHMAVEQRDNLLGGGHLFAAVVGES